MKTNFLKRLAALCIALVMALGMTMTVSAAISAGATGTISVTDAEAGVQVTAYHLMDVNYDTTANQPVDPVYSWVDEIANWVRENYPDYIGKVTDNSVQEAFKSTAKPTDIVAFYDALAAQIRSNKIAPSKSETADTAGNATITGLQMGNYLVLVENGLKVYSPSAVNLVPVWTEVDGWVMSTARVALKSAEPGITKTAETADVNDLAASIGDTVNYTVTADVPGYPAKTLNQNKIFNIYDTLEDGLTLNTGSFQVTGYVNGVEGTATNLTDRNTDKIYYTLTTSEAQDLDGNGVSFSIVFNYDALKAGDGTRFDTVQVKYNATVDADAQAFDSNAYSGNLGNTAKLSYGNNPYAENATHEDKTDEAKVYTYGVNISKVDAKEENKFLSGARFTISTNNDGTNSIKFVNTGDGVYRKAVTNDEAGATETLTVGANPDRIGKLSLEGLDAGIYYLTETKAPDEYNKLGAPVEIKITDTDRNGIVNDGTEAANGADGYTDVTVKNSQGFQLPTTGGIGTVIFTACGVLLMGLGAAVIAFVLMRRRRS